MKKTLFTLSVIVFAAAVHAQTYNARGDFNSWGETPLNNNGDGTYSLTIGGGTPGATFEFKIAQDGWTYNWPGSNVRSVYDASGNSTFWFRPGSMSDGWSPAADRVGYADPGMFGWEVIGSFNGWSSPLLSLNSMGAGVYSGSIAIATPSSYEFKFRKTGDWAISIGSDFGNSAGNATLTTTLPNQVAEFVLDLPNGRWQVTAVPEPTVIALLAAGTMLLALRRKF